VLGGHQLAANLGDSASLLKVTRLLESHLQTTSREQSLIQEAVELILTHQQEVLNALGRVVLGIDIVDEAIRVGVVAVDEAGEVLLDGLHRRLEVDEVQVVVGSETAHASKFSDGGEDEAGAGDGVHISYGGEEVLFQG
jgi:hypothetical protein